MTQRNDKNDGNDFLGRELKPGMVVIRPQAWGRAIGLQQCTIREIRDGKIYLDKSKVPINFSGRLLVISLGQSESGGS